MKFIENLKLLCVNDFLKDFRIKCFAQKKPLSH